MAEGTTDINPRIIEIDGQAIFNNSIKIKDQSDSILDNTWSRSAFLISDSKIANVTDKANRYWSSATNKFVDTRLGGNIGINSRPQFTRYSDIRVKGNLAGRQDVKLDSVTGNYGMGRYYSEAIDDSSQIVYMRFGVPQFNSLTDYLLRAFDSSSVALARTGRTPSAFFTAGRLVGTAVGVKAFPVIAITILAGKAINAVFLRPTSKFYTMKPTMHLYWSTVNTLVNTLAINKGILPKIMASEEDEKLGRPFTLDQDYLNAISSLMPDIFTGSNYFNIWSTANKAQRMANQQYVNDYDDADKSSPTDYTGRLMKTMTGNGSHVTNIRDDNGKAGISGAIERLIQFGYYIENDEKSEKLELDPRAKENKDPNWYQEFFTYFDADFRGGAQFATFRVDNTGSVSESFGNSTVESDLSSKINGLSSQARQARFSFADGNIIGGNIIGDLVQGTIGAAKDLMVGALDGVTVGFSTLLMGIGGSGYMDIPKNWQSSTATLPKSNYTIQLISPYGNPMSQMINIYIPLCMLLAGSLPLSTGKQSYTSPFLCQIYDRGRCQVRLGMIESLSITRGTSSLAFNKIGAPLAIDVSFSVVDLSSIMHMPVSSGKIFEFDITLDEDNILTDYLAVLANQSMWSQIYPMAKAKLTIAKEIMKYNKLTSASYWSSLFHESATSGTIETATLGLFNVFEGLARNSSLVEAKM